MHFVLLFVSSWVIYQYKTTICKQNTKKANHLHFLNMAVGPQLGLKPSLKLSFKQPKSN